MLGTTVINPWVFKLFLPGKRTVSWIFKKGLFHFPESAAYVICQP